jgi:hypothetical protein
MYSATFEPPSRIVRRGPGGSSFPFAPGLESIHVTYVTGRTSVPDNAEPGVQILGFFVPNRVRELLAPSRKAPGIA